MFFYFLTLLDHGAMTFDGWTDNIHRRSYNTYTFHYIDNEWNLKSTVLKTCLMESAHTAKNICDDFNRILREFQLENKKIVCVTDNAANMISACRMIGKHRLPCIAHRANLLIQRDMMQHPSVKEIPALISKIRDGQKKLMYRFDDLRQIRDKDNQNQMALLLNEICELDEIVDAEEQYVSDDADISTLIRDQNQNEFSGMKSLNNIRWNCVQKVASSYKKNASEFYSVHSFFLHLFRNTRIPFASTHDTMSKLRCLSHRQIHSESSTFCGLFFCKTKLIARFFSSHIKI